VQKPGSGSGGATQFLAVAQLVGGSGGGGGGSGASSGVGAEAEAAGAPVTALILSGAPWTVERALEILNDLDVAPRQVHISAMITEVDRSDVSYLGIDWSGGGSTGFGQAGIPFTMGEPFAVDEEGNPMEDAAVDLEIGKIQRTVLQWNATIHALEQQGRARILSNPSVMTLDGRQTALHTGETYYYEVAVAASPAAGGGVVTDTRTFDTGINLMVNPHINNDSEVTLTISPIVSALAGVSEFSLPVVSERTVVTTVRVKSGETAVIAGLVSDIEQTVIKKIPFLGDLPIAGELFKYREKKPQHREVLIFVTPTIIGEAA
jgi:type II secretory pathway component GspD/PulD (secretin)